MYLVHSVAGTGLRPASFHVEQIGNDAVRNQVAFGRNVIYGLSLHDISLCDEFFGLGDKILQFACPESRRQFPRVDSFVGPQTGHNELVVCVLRGDLLGFVLRSLGFLAQIFPHVGNVPAPSVAVERMAAGPTPR